MEVINIYDASIPSDIRYVECLQEAKREHYTAEPMMSSASRYATLRSTLLNIHRSNTKIGGILLRLTTPNFWV